MCLCAFDAGVVGAASHVCNVMFVCPFVFVVPLLTSSVGSHPLFSQEQDIQPPSNKRKDLHPCCPEGPP